MRDKKSKEGDEMPATEVKHGVIANTSSKKQSAKIRPMKVMFESNREVAEFINWAQSRDKSHEMENIRNKMREHREEKRRRGY